MILQVACSLLFTNWQEARHPMQLKEIIGPHDYKSRTLCHPQVSHLVLFVASHLYPDRRGHCGVSASPTLCPYSPNMVQRTL